MELTEETNVLLTNYDSVLLTHFGLVVDIIVPDVLSFSRDMCRIIFEIKTALFIQYNLSIPNLVYSKIRFNPNKLFGPNAIYYIFHIKLSCVFPNPVHSEFRT